MTRDEIKDKLQGIFHELFDDNTIKIHDEMTAKEVKGWDSLNHINLIVAVEQRFQVSLTTKEVAGLKNVGSLIALLQSKLSPN